MKEEQGNVLEKANKQHVAGGLEMKFEIHEKRQ